MALDPNIILQARGVQLDSPLDTYARVAQVQAARNQNRIGPEPDRPTETTDLERNRN